MKKNKNIREIHATPVHIYSNSTKVYKNNKEIKDWEKSGDLVLIMPGEYIISDKSGNTRKIEVGTNPMDVYLGDSHTSTNVGNNVEDARSSSQQSTTYDSSYQQNNTNTYRQNSTRNYNSTYPVRRNNIQNQSSNRQRIAKEFLPVHRNNIQNQSSYMTPPNYTNRYYPRRRR